MIGQTLCDSYRLTRRLGGGAMGTVYEAEQVRLKRTVALKILANEHREHVAALKRFHNEARALVLLDHPHIVRIFDFAICADGRPFLVMERLYGDTVGDRLAAGRPFSVEATVGIALQVGEALVAAHSKGIVHRDLKPDNLFLSSDPEHAESVKVLDFGISRLPDSEGERITTESEVLGTPEYMSPEQARGRNDLVNGRTDQHALAVVMYEMLSGVSPFASADVDETLRKIALEVAPLVTAHAPEVPRALALVMHRAMAKNPVDRYSGIDEFTDAVRMATHSQSAVQGPVSMPVTRGLGPRDPVRTLSLILSRARTAFLKNDLPKATALATTALDTTAFTEDEAVLAVVEMAKPLLEGIFHTYLEPMDRRLAHGTTEPSLLSADQASFRSYLRPLATIAEAVQSSSFPRLDTLRMLVELQAAGALSFELPIPRPRSLAAPMSGPRVPSSASVPRLKRA